MRERMCVCVCVCVRACVRVHVSLCVFEGEIERESVCANSDTSSILPLQCDRYEIQSGPDLLDIRSRFSPPILSISSDLTQAH